MYAVFPAVFNGFYTYAHLFLSYIVMNIYCENKRRCSGTKKEKDV